MRFLVLALLLSTRTPAHAQFVPGNGPGAAAVPPVLPSSVQTDAPSVNPASPALLDRAETPRPFTLAFDWPLDDVDRGLAGTLRFDPLALAEGRRSNASGASPRVGASVTLGGPTQIADSTRASRRPNIADHVTAELKLRLLGHRQRGDPPFVLGLSLDADTYATGFGRDLYAATLIAEMPRPFNLTANVGYRPEEEVHENRNQELKLAVGTSWRWFAGSRLLGPVDATLSGGELVRDHGRANVSLLNSKVELPRSNGMRLIASMTCSNHPERMGEGVVRGSVGVSYGLSR